MNAMTNEHAAVLEVCAKQARKAARMLARTDAETRNEGLRSIASAIRDHSRKIVAANEEDLVRADVSDAFRDRLTLTEARIAAMAQGVATIAELPDPLSREPEAWTRPNGLLIRRVAGADRRHRHDLRKSSKCRCGRGGDLS